MGNSKSKQKELTIDVQSRTDTNKKEDDITGCCIRINKLTNKNSFTCCMKTGDKSDDTIIIGNKNMITTSIHHNYK